MLLTPPPPVTNCHTFSDPLERDILYGRPPIIIYAYRSAALLVNSNSL